MRTLEKKIGVRMRTNVIVAIAAVAALMIGAFMLYASAELFSEMNPDPYNHSYEYTVTGMYGEEELIGKASYETISENGSFHNYRFLVKSGTANGIEIERSFTIIFDENDVPLFYDRVGSDPTGSSSTYIQKTDGYVYKITVSDLCVVNSFSVENEEWVMNGTIII